MTAAALALRVRRRERPVATEAPPLDPRWQFVRGALLLAAAIALSLVLQLLFISPLQARAAQQHAFDSFRQQAASGTAPLAAGDLKHKKGSAVAYLQVPAIGLKQAIIEGTDAGDLFKGPGHRRDTPLPGQLGTSVVMGRRAAFGGPFAHINQLHTRDIIKVTTGAGVFEYRVIDVRHAGDVAPPPLRGAAGRIALVTADGAPFFPSGVVVVDADLIVPGLGGTRPLLTSTTLPNSEKLLAVDLGTLWRLVLWLQALIIVVVGAVIAWQRWHRAKAWVVFLPPLMLVGLFTAGEAVRLMPNLL